jgi:hypothetical protein
VIPYRDLIVEKNIPGSGHDLTRGLFADIKPLILYGEV